jgi:hypothetical protein
MTRNLAIIVGTVVGILTLLIHPITYLDTYLGMHTIHLIHSGGRTYSRTALEQ